MKFPFFRALSLTLVFGLASCAHHAPESKFSYKDLSSEEAEELNRAALTIASERLKQMVSEAKGNQATTNFLATDLFLKANMSLMEGDFATAAVLFEHLSNLVPHDSFVQKKFAVSLIRSGDLAKAETVLEELFKKTKDEKVALILGGVYSGTDKEDKARVVYQSILKTNPKNEDACIFLSKSYALAKEHGKAFTQLASCSKHDPKNGMFDFYAGKIYLDSEKVKEAKAAFQKAYTKQPSLSQAVNAHGVLLEDEEKWDEVVSLYKQHLKKSPLDSQILSRIVNVLFIRERYVEVIPYAEKLSDLEPENLNLKVKLGILYTDAKKFPEAVSIFKDLLGMAPASDKILYYLGAIYQETEQYENSIEYFNQIPSSSGLYADSSIQMANMLSTLAQENGPEAPWKEAFLTHVNKKIEELKDLRVEFSVIKSGFFESVGDYKNAMDAMVVVSDEKGFSTQHKYYLANLYEKQKRFKDSTDLIMGIIEKEPKNAHAWNFLGYSLLERGDELDVAYEYIKKAYDISPDDGYIRDSLGWYYFKKGDVKRALSELQLAHKKVPDDIEILKHLATIHRELKDFPKAKTFLQSALKAARYETEKKEIMSRIQALETDRIPASRDLD